MKIVFDSLVCVRVNKGEYEGQPYYRAFFLENGYTHKFSCSKAFYDTVSNELKNKQFVTLKNLPAEYQEFGDKKRIKII